MRSLGRPVQVLALCAALAPGLAAASPSLGALPLGPLLAGAQAKPAPEEKLAQMRGGSDAPWSDMKLAGSVANNSAVNVATGNNIVTDGAFSNASGLPMVIQNSGANVLIQNATIVNVQIK